MPISQSSKPSFALRVLSFNSLFAALACIATILPNVAKAQKQPVDYVNAFIGTTNFGTTNPGAVCPNGLMSVVPFNVMGSANNKFDKDARWWSTPYEYHNVYFTGYSHVNPAAGFARLLHQLLTPLRRTHRSNGHPAHLDGPLLVPQRQEQHFA